ncbi:6-O-methylguanine DNA methyltransferase [Candidatus Adlerbacteria bacterium RIFCSPLOWO2_01_FULL_54_21b]|uniref:6-O-methylguanine DNA methyltransferase n=1 Tax=Candidatus Adlerbacteria bacterium RIFCSPLOWO2_01_FULL_54_21b TaxID=1797245 RepID=A0A1F4XWY0_9BACT|nr:MAG: 6-O-methylguanine DNA methyltransferase [Candidatus Adlerbacteria bacterium RIFCSPLOWO2_01_FULL_54_21b]
MKNQKTIPFSKKVYAVVARIPRGRTMSYKQVAKKAGNSRAARAVGTLMSKNFDPKIPCHRVIRSDGKVGDYNRGGPSRKIELLLEEAYRK